MNDDTTDEPNAVDEKGRVEFDARVIAEEAWLREFFTFDDAIKLLAFYRVFAEFAKAKMAEVRVLSEEFALMHITKMDESVAVSLSAIDDGEASTAAMIRSFDAATNRGKSAADALHNKPGGSRARQDAVRAAWASGKYSSRSICAEQESASLGMSFDAARRALRNTPDPA